MNELFWERDKLFKQHVAKIKAVPKDRQGKQVTFPLASISIAVVTNVKRKFINFIEFGEIAAEMKEYAKSFSGSVCKVDNRTN